MTNVGVSGRLPGLCSSFSFAGSASSGRGSGGGSGARFGHWPISAFSKVVGWEKSERLFGQASRVSPRECRM